MDIASLLDRRFVELGVSEKARARAAFLGSDPGTFSKILRGGLKLSEKRATAWSAKLFRGDPGGATAFAKLLIEVAGEQPTAPLSVNDFCERIIAEGGAVPAYRFVDLLVALQAPDIEKVLVCCEYRDIPRAGPDAKYQHLAKELGKAIASGVSFAMFQPFGRVIPLPEANKANTPAFNAALYMMQIRNKCIDTYRLFWEEALSAIGDIEDTRKTQTLPVLHVGDTVTTNDTGAEELCHTLGQTWDEVLVGSRLQLYMRSDEGYPYLGSGFQARMFYIRYTTKADGANPGANHSRILQWVSSPREDLLIYRGEIDIHPDALKDSFYPIPHFFDTVGRLPLKIDDSHRGGPGVRKYLKHKPGGEGLPEVEVTAPEGEQLPENLRAKSIWTGYD